jgi:hypothetical protein
MAARERNTQIEGHEEQFRKLKVLTQDILATTQEVLNESEVPSEICDEALACVAREPSESQRELVCCYKLAFDKMKTEPVREEAAF